MQDQSRMTAGEWGLLVLLSVLWGGSFFFSKIIVQEVPPFTLVLVRFTLAAAVLGAYLKAQRTSVPWTATTWVAFAGMGALNNLIPAALIAWSQQTIASGLASVLIATTPVFSILVAHYFTNDDRMSANKVAGVALGVAGVAALVGIDALDGSLRTLPGILGCLGAALSYGFANVFGRRFKRLGIAPTVGAFGQLAATAVMVAPAAFVFDRPWLLVPALCGGMGGDDRPRAALDGPGLRHLLPAARECGNDEHIPCDAADPGQRHPLGNPHLGRAPVRPAARRHGADRAWLGRHRRSRPDSLPFSRRAEDRQLMRHMHGAGSIRVPFGRR